MITLPKNKHDIKTGMFAVAMVFSLVTAGLFIVLPAQKNAYATSTPQEFIDTQQAAKELLTADTQQQGSLTFRIGAWSPTVTVESGKVAAIFADCNPGEFALSPQFMFQEKGILLLQSFAVALPDNSMTWLAVVYNAAGEDLLASVGVICVNDNGDNSNGSVSLDANTRTTIQNTVNRLIVSGQPVNVNHIVNVYQSIVQNAINIVNLTGNNNTVNQVINQSANNIVASNGSSVNQTISQNAENIIGQNMTTVGAPSIDINQNATTTPTEEETTPIENTTENGIPPASSPTSEDTNSNSTTTGSEETTTTDEETTTTTPASEDTSEEDTTTPPPADTTTTPTEDTTPTTDEDNTTEEDSSTTTDGDSTTTDEDSSSTEEDSSSSSSTESESDTDSSNSEEESGDNDGA